jgi:(p)ppGpp synthase/HD superfamily hydrolase
MAGTSGAKGGGLFSKFTGIFSVGGGKAAVGLSIGSSSVKLVELKKVGSGWKLTKFQMAPIPEDAMVNREIINPIAVATILAQMHLDCETIMAALLHDVIEDTDYKKEHLEQQFGEAVAEMVDGVSKLHNLNDKSKKDAKSKKESDAASFHKMMMAVTRDIRVIIIKLADRLHNLRTQWFMNDQTRRRKALETLELYAPIADRLGLGRMRDELIDLGFSGYYAFRSRVIQYYLRQYYESHLKAIQLLETQLSQKLEKNR